MQGRATKRNPTQRNAITTLRIGATNATKPIGQWDGTELEQSDDDNV